MMIFFPVPYPDELFFSIVSRYHYRSGNNTFIHTIEDIYGTRNGVSSIEFPTMLGNILEQLPHNICPDMNKMIEDNTLLGFYTAFKDARIKNSIKQKMISSEGKSIFMQLGLTASGVHFHKYLRYCPLCLSRDEELYGESYWHREHQVSGVYVCKIHNVLTKDSLIQKHLPNRQIFTRCQSKLCKNTLEESSSVETKNHMKNYAEYASFLTNSTYNFSLTWIKNRIRILLYEKGYAQLNNYVHIKQLKNDFIEYFTDEYLAIMNCDTDLKWIDKIIGKSLSTPDTTRYILLLQFLNILPEEFFSFKIELDDIDIKKHLQNEWDKKLIKLMGFNLSQREICKLLKTSRTTLVKEVDRLKLETNWVSNCGRRYDTDYIKTDEFKKKKIEIRTFWLDWHKENSDSSTSSHAIRKNHDHVYEWLRKYDKEWMKKRYIRKDKTHVDRVNWGERDEKLHIEAKCIVEAMKARGNERITLGRVAAFLNIKGWIYKKQNKIPQTMEFLNKEIETVNEFHKRKLMQTYNRMKEEAVTTYNAVFEASKINYRYKENLREYGEKLIDENYSI